MIAATVTLNNAAIDVISKVVFCASIEFQYVFYYTMGNAKKSENRIIIEFSLKPHQMESEKFPLK